MKLVSLAVREALLVGNYALTIHFPELKQHLVDNNFSTRSMRDVLGVVYLIDCYFTGRHKHKSDKAMMALGQQLLAKLFGWSEAKSMVDWKNSDLLGKYAEVNPKHLLSRFMFTTGLYDKDNSETRTWGFKPDMLARLYDFTSGYQQYIKDVPNGMRPSGSMISVEVGTIPKIDKWLDTKTGVTGKNHAAIAEQCGVTARTVKNWNKAGRVLANPNSELSGKPAIMCNGRIIASYIDIQHKAVKNSKKVPTDVNPASNIVLRNDWNWTSQVKSKTAVISKVQLEKLEDIIWSKLDSHRKTVRVTGTPTLEMHKDLTVNHNLLQLREMLTLHECRVHSTYQKHLYGRWYIINQGLNLQTIPREYRKILLADKFEYDLDAAHPSIIRSIVGDNVVPTVVEYINNKVAKRKELAEYCGATIQEVKDSFNAMNNLSPLLPGYTLTMPKDKLAKLRKHPFIKAYQSEMKTAARIVTEQWELHGNVFHENSDTVSKKMSCVLQNFEAWVMELTERYVDDVELILHDAIYTTNPISPSLLNKIETEVSSKYGVDIRFGV